MKKEFEISDMGLIHYFLEIEDDIGEAVDPSLYRSLVGNLIDWGGNVDDHKSTSGYAFGMGLGVFSWTSKKQSVVALSTTEAEYISLVAAGCQALWLKINVGRIESKEAFPTPCGTALRTTSGMPLPTPKKTLAKETSGMPLSRWTLCRRTSRRPECLF
ncbi:putative mitochondrial protein [Cucumis melo var. makuwa]|uniref:Mitochondrial protein n=1 Tax=Cucumis melo var. makuwa TaxID=1194695 RepID=A0A5A7VC17_CUCMM|nr:putative mitochondrial protein [Cucumis melo var. makuwa]